MQTEVKNILEEVESEIEKKKEKEVIGNSLKPHKDVCEGTVMYIEKIYNTNSEKKNKNKNGFLYFDWILAIFGNHVTMAEWFI